MMQVLPKALRPGAGVVVMGAILAAAIGAGPVSAGAAEIAPHHALYSMSLGSTHGDAGVTGAGGTMAYQWGETCDGWTVEQRYRLKMAYAESSDVSIASNFVTWEAKDGLKYRFNQKETRNGKDNEEIRGQAKLDGPEKGGTVEFEKPQAKSIKLPPGVLFPSAQTIFLIDKAKAGENFISRQIFDGATVENAVLVSGFATPAYYRLESGTRYGFSRNLPGPLPAKDPGGTVLSWYENGALRFDTAAPTPELAEFMEVHEASRRYRRSLDRSDWVDVPAV